MFFELRTQLHAPDLRVAGDLSEGRGRLRRYDVYPNSAMNQNRIVTSTMSVRRRQAHRKSAA